jgi:hypothetical protein
VVSRLRSGSRRIRNLLIARLRRTRRMRMLVEARVEKYWIDRYPVFIHVMPFF